MPPPVYVPPPPPVIAPPTPVVYQGGYQAGYQSSYRGSSFIDCCSGWYLRGDIGMTNQSVDHLFNVLYNDPATSVTNVSKGFDSSMLLGVGIGYQINNWLRADATGEYRGRANFHGLDVYSTNGVISGTDEYTGSKSEWLYLANLYVDLGTWWCLTPFVGVGVGMAKITIHDFQDVNTPNQAVAFGKDASQWNFAWAIHAGVAYEVSQSLSLELSYRYVNLGDGQSGDLQTYLGQNDVNNPMIFKDITSQDIRLGMRWKFGCCDAPLPPPPQPVYQPVYQPPPLMRRG